ncbi:saccharopine dehydrogenase [Saccharomonospora sp. CUA-673]|uniref:saccharopine dehydrogenase NADP-binding domain-containing protein n=1 Tax=Saccharomonospora sp. CUA-673 TaxID=1904969 RepID=UPI000969E23B|nr:saccharopine dehydrogenase NADP-binding domain-containing protein [Saccharomonospora sp. CUA-673]OLT38749.1 saccharopine dehydrogenase [Saccharomonospora sp. CUA-673]
MNRRVLVYGAYGHTGRFVVADLVRRGLAPVLSGRNAAALGDLAAEFPGLDVRPATIDDLDTACRGVAAVVNCAGPFLDTGPPVATAAARAGAHYVDVTAEQAAATQVYRAAADVTEVAVVPATAFFGGLGDLLATAAMGDWPAADEVTVAIGIDRWWPTAGTRATGRRNTATRLVVAGGELVAAPAQPPSRTWAFGPPLGERTVVEAPLSEIVVLHRHLRASSISTYLAADALADLRNETTPPPTAVDARGRSAQRFVVDVEVRRGTRTRRATASGRDIYAVTAPLVGEAVQRLVKQRLLEGRAAAHGPAAPGELFDPHAFLDALTPEHLTWQHS